VTAQDDEALASGEMMGSKVTVVAPGPRRGLLGLAVEESEPRLAKRIIAAVPGITRGGCEEGSSSEDWEACSMETTARNGDVDAR